MRDPRAFEVLHVGGIDLVERRIARIIPIAADRRPFLTRGLAQIQNALRLEHAERNKNAHRNGHRRYF